MTEDFILDINYKGEDRAYKANLILQGYSHRFRVLAEGREIFFEPDEQGGYRAVQMPGQDPKEMEKIDRNLLALLGERITSILA